MMPLLVGTDGTKKMSKSYDNYIGITEDANDMYGKVLSIPDDLIFSWFELLTDIDVDELPKYEKKAKEDPRNTKHELALIITRMYHGQEKAKAARKHFEQAIIGNQVPDDAPTLEYETNSEVRLLDIVSDAGFTSSNGETKRLIKQGGISIDDEKVSDKGYRVSFEDDTEFTLKVGKRNYAIVKSK
jgi:tyrosyl-tRNA synthetase